MIQNHILQLLCLIAMEPPNSFKAGEIQNRRADVLHCMRKFDSESIRKSVVRGQYGEGWMEGKEVPGYRQEKGVNPAIEYRNLCRHKVLYRQLALAGRSVLCEDRQTNA